MAEFNFYATRKDSLEVLHSVFDRGDLRATPNLHYSSTKPESYREPGPELLEALAKRNGVMYLTGRFSNRSLHVREMPNGKYYIDITYGGPAMGLSLPLRERRGGVWHLGPGTLWHPRSYWNDAITHPIRPSEELKGAYANLVKRIKSVTNKRRIGVTLWIGAEALSLLGKYRALILVKGKWLDVDGKFVKSNQ